MSTPRFCMLSRGIGERKWPSTPSYGSRLAWRSTSAIPTAPGSAARTRTPMGCCGSTFQRAPTSARTARTILRPWRSPSTAGRERPLAGGHRPRLWTSSSDQLTRAVLRRPRESTEDAPRLVVHTDTTPANVHEAVRTAPIHEALAAKGLAPCEHLVDSAYVSADDLIMAHEQYGIALVGPARPDQSWQSRAEEAFSSADFAVDWDRRVARCPEGKESTGWFESAKRPGQRSSIRARFRAADCRACASRTRCPRARSYPHVRVLALLPRREYGTLAASGPGRARRKVHASARSPK